MKLYYLLDYFSIEDKRFFENSLKLLKNPLDIYKLIDQLYYRVELPYNRNEKTNNSFTLQTWLFIKYVWENFGISPNEINWIYKDGLVILNEKVFWLKNNKWINISNEKNSFIVSSLYPFTSPFWFYLKKLHILNNKVPKLLYPNDYKIYVRDDKLRYILNIYEKREKLIGNFMLPYFSINNVFYLRKLLELWKEETGQNKLILKYAWATDNGKLIKLIDLDEYLSRDDLLEYLYLKFTKNITEYSSSIYFTDFYSIKKEFRLYVSKDKFGKYNIYSCKNKVNLTPEEELKTKTNLHTGLNLKIKWEFCNLNNFPSDIKEMVKYIFEVNNFDTGVIEFVLDKNDNIRFLEINNLGGSLMFSGEDENNIIDRLYDMWDYLFTKNR